MNLNSNQKWMQRTSLFLAVVATGMVAPAWAQTSLPLHPEAEEPVPQAAPQSVDPEAAAAAAAAVEAVNTIAPEPSPQAGEALLGQSVHQVLPAYRGGVVGHGADSPLPAAREWRNWSRCGL